MNSPTDFLQGIHERLNSLPNDLASLISSPRGSDLDDVEFPNVPTPSTAEAESPSVPQQEASDSPFPEMPAFSAPDASFPDPPVLGSADVSDSPFPSAAAPSSIEASFPSAPSFAGAADSSGSGPVGSSFDKDDIMIGHLEEMAKGISALTRAGGGKQSFMRSNGPTEVRGPSFYVADMDNDEGFTQGSPSVNASSTAGLRGAGGHGFGSRYSRQASALHGSGPSRGGQDQFLEGGR